MIKLTIVIPCYNSEDTIKEVVDETIKYFNKMNKFQYEVVLVNDGSCDSTYEQIEKLSLGYQCVTAIDLAKNFGQHNAILAGMHFATGDYIVGMDDDLQTHPSQIKILIDKLEEGYDVVYGRYVKREHGLLRNIGSKLNDLTVRTLIGKPKGLQACNFYIIRQFVRDEIIKSQSSYTNLQGLFLRTTAHITNADITHCKRKSGKSGYTLEKLVKLWSSFLNYTIKPIRLILGIGTLMLVSGCVYLIASLIFTLEHTDLTLSLYMIISAIIILSLGIVGEYIARAFEICSEKPQYVIRKINLQKNIKEELNEEENTDTGVWKRTS